MQTIYMCGFLAGTITFGVISDRYNLAMLCVYRDYQNLNILLYTNFVTLYYKNWLLFYQIQLCIYSPIQAMEKVVLELEERWSSNNKTKWDLQFACR